MNAKLPAKLPRNDPTFASNIGEKAARKLKARRNTASVWFGLGTMGIIGWGIAIPTLVGAAAGVWLDKQCPGAHSWTLALLVAGLVIGCWNAWRWVAAQDEAMRQEDEDDHE